MRWLDSMTNSMDTNSGRQRRTGKSGVLQSMGLQRVGHNLVTEQQALPEFLSLHHSQKLEVISRVIIVSLPDKFSA